MEFIYNKQDWPIGTIEQGERGFYFTEVLDGSDDYNVIVGEHLIHLKSNAIAHIKRRFKQYQSANKIA